METEQPPNLTATPAVITVDSDPNDEVLATVPKSVSVHRVKRSSSIRKEVMFTNESDDEESNDSIQAEGKELRSLNDVVAGLKIDESEEFSNTDSNNSASTPDEILPKRLTLRERAEKLMRGGSVSKNKVVHQSVDMLNEKALASKTIDSYSEQNAKADEKGDKAGKDSPKASSAPNTSQTHSPQIAVSPGPTPSAKAILESRSIPLRSGSPLSPIAGSAAALDKDSDMPTNSTRALNSETKSIFGRPSAATGYQKGRAAISGTAETKSIYGDLKGSPVEGPTGASYATMSTLRSTKTSNMLPRNGSQASLGASESPKTPVAAPKTFKEFYATLLRGIIST